MKYKFSHPIDCINFKHITVKISGKKKQINTFTKNLIYDKYILGCMDLQGNVD